MGFAQWRRYNFTLGIGFGLKSTKRYFLIRINSAIETIEYVTIITQNVNVERSDVIFIQSCMS